METPEGADHDSLITQLCGVTGMTAENAGALLDAHQWKVDAAAATYFEMQAQDKQEGLLEEQEEQQSIATSGSATAAASSSSTQNASGRAQPLSGVTVAGSSIASAPRTNKAKQKPKGGLKTLRDLQKDSSSRGQGNDSDDDDDNDDEQDFYAGGEKSGLAVQNPDTAADQVNEILNRARRNMPRPGGDNPREQPTHFGGTGITLGGDDTPSRVIADPNAKRERTAPAVERILHLWQDGFSVDDGPLYRYDDQANAAMLAMINSGRAPLSILNVEHDQEVDLKVFERRGEKYTKPKPKYKPFSGSGQRLGSPVPGTDNTSTAAAAATSSNATQPNQSTGNTTSSSTSAPSDTGVSVNESEPTVSLQIRLGDGTRLQSRFNTSHTIGDVYSFVDGARASGDERGYALMTTFPSRELSDRSVALRELSEFKRGGVIVQKWT